MSAYTDYEKNEGHLGRRYRTYQRVYNETFAADVNPSLRKFDELAAMDSPQWKRLEVYRGNDQEAQHAHLSHPDNPLFKPTEKEAESWAANHDDKWRVEREPAFDKHPGTNNKWLDLTPQQRNAEGAQKFLAAVDARHAGKHDATEMPGLAVADFETLQARRPQAQAHAQEKVAKAQVEVAQASAAPVQQSAAQVQAPQRSRLSIAAFNTPADAIQSLHDTLATRSDSELKVYRAQVDADHQAAGQGPIALANVKTEAFAAHQALRQQQQTLRAQEVASDQQSQRRSHSQ